MDNSFSVILLTALFQHPLDGVKKRRGHQDKIQFSVFFLVPLKFPFFLMTFPKLHTFTSPLLSSKTWHFQFCCNYLVLFSSQSHDPVVWSSSQQASRCDVVWWREPVRVSQSSAGSPGPDRLSAAGALWCVYAHAGPGMCAWPPAMPAVSLWRLCVTMFMCCETNGECVSPRTMSPC